MSTLQISGFLLVTVALLWVVARASIRIVEWVSMVAALAALASVPANLWNYAQVRKLEIREQSLLEKVSIVEFERQNTTSSPPPRSQPPSLRLSGSSVDVLSDAAPIGQMSAGAAHPLFSSEIGGARKESSAPPCALGSEIGRAHV